MDNKLKVGVVGLGFFGGMHARVWANHPQVSLVGLCDLDQNRLNKTAQSLKVERTYRDYQEMLKDPEIDVVDVVVPEIFHLSPVLDALNAGKHVFVEKPIAATVEDAVAIEQLVEKTGRFLMVGHILRFDVRHCLFKKRIQEGIIGDIVSIHTRRTTARAATGKDSLKVTKQLHPIVAGSIHDTDLMHWLTEDTVKKVYAEQRAVVDGEHPDTGFAMLTFNRGTVGILEIAFILPPKSPGLLDYVITVIGTNGKASLLSGGRGFEFWTEEGVICPDTDFVEPYMDGQIVGPLREELSYFANCVINGKAPTRNTAQDGVNGIRVCHAIVESAEKGDVVNLEAICELAQ